MKDFSIVNEKVKGFLHGGDYNPDQWLNYPEILKEDIRLLKMANCNCVTLNIFGWSAIEPEEGKYEFEWLDSIMDNLAKEGIHVILATPSGARPAWMSQKYPEVLRVNGDRTRILHGQRHNHCYTSPIYREKTSKINRILAERYKNHPSLIMWHISNEYGGECHCELCQEAFRNWLKKKYDNSLEKINEAWWTGFWSHKITNWSQIESPSVNGEIYVHGHNLDWKRFVTDQTIDFYKNEIAPIREITPNIKVTTNFMGDYPKMGLFNGLDYWKFAKEVDVISWDSYPAWHNNFETTWELAANVGFVNDVYRSLKGGQPFLIMESTPSLVNWHKVNKGKRPGMHILSSMQSVAHGSDSVLYFQWRKGRGGSEKFHGAVVDHCGHENTRVFREVTKLGENLDSLKEIVGATVSSEVAIIYDWENRWAIEDCQGLSNDTKDYMGTCQKHYNYFWENGIAVDIINMESDFSNYKILVAPMLYMVRDGVGDKINEFVKNGGTLITTYFSGVVDQNDLCFLGGFPGPLRDVTGVWVEEIDTLYDSDTNKINMKLDNELNINGTFSIKDYCDVIHAETAEVLATYSDDYYSGMPAVTVNKYGKGKAYYIGARIEEKFIEELYSSITKKLEVSKAIDSDLPSGVTVQMRSSKTNDYIFVMNFSEENKLVKLDSKEYVDMITNEVIKDSINIEKYGVRVLKR